MIVTSSDLCWHMKVDSKKKSPQLRNMPIADDVFTHWHGHYWTTSKGRYMVISMFCYLWIVSLDGVKHSDNNSKMQKMLHQSYKMKLLPGMAYSESY